MSLLIPITIHSTEIPAIVDTAAQVSVINKDLIEKIGLQPEVESMVLLKGVSQNGHLNGYVLKDIEITILNGQPYLTNMYAADIRDPLLLGLDFLHRFCCNIDLRDITLRIGVNVVAGTLKTNTYKH